jgi:DNA-binding transcriptional regulator YhcF (GntR family)
MQLWFSHTSEVSIREQLVTQVVLGILSDDLAPGQRLPSTRELARRFRIHANTVSAGYRQLERDRWVEMRHGSGVYVRDRKPHGALDASLAIDQLIAGLFRSARKLGTPLGDVRARLRKWLEMQPPDHFLLIEPNYELCEIVAAEMRQAVSFEISSCGLSEAAEKLPGAIAVTLPNRAKTVRQTLPEGTELLELQTRSVPASLAAYLPAPTEALVGIASGWPDFLKLARTFLLAAGFSANSLVVRDTRKTHWQRGLEQTRALVCDTLTAASAPKHCHVIPFPLLSESSIKELQRYEDFIRQPFAGL